MTTAFQLAPFEYKFVESGGNPAGTFEGYAATFNNIDDGGDRILAGSFIATLAEFKAAGKMPKMLLNHGGLGGLFAAPKPDDLLPIGKWLEMSEDSKGLQSHGRLINLDTESGKRIYGAMKEGELDSLSIGYKAAKFVRGTRAGEPRRTISEAKLFEVSPVTFPMNRHAGIDSEKSLDDMTIREFEEALRNGMLPPLSASAAKALLAGGFKAIRSERDAGEGMSDLAAIARRNIATLS